MRMEPANGRLTALFVSKCQIADTGGQKCHGRVWLASWIM